jgi:hypothetical protein
MSKPIREIRLTTADGRSGTVKAVSDSGSFYTILREDKVPPGAAVIRREEPRVLRAAARAASLSATAELPLVLSIGDREVADVALITPDLSQEMLVGAGTLQKWDISIVNEDGCTEVDGVGAILVGPLPEPTPSPWRAASASASTTNPQLRYPGGA